MKHFVPVREEGFRWFGSGDALAKGFLEYQGKIYLNEDVASLFSKVGSWSEFIDTLKIANGCFAVAVQVDGAVFSAVDKLRSIPLFFREDTAEVSDDINSLTGFPFAKANNDALLPFIKCGYTIGSDTLIAGVKQLQAGQALSVKDGELVTSYYFRHSHATIPSPAKSREQYYDELNEVTDAMARRLVESLNGRQVAIPLSGGYDSRYVAAMLYLQGYRNVVCYTYGRPESFEVGISKKVASVLGYEWHFIEYTREKWQDYIEDKEFPIFASGLCSLPHIQDYIAIKELMQDGTILPSAIVVPGHSGDLLGGSYVPKEIRDGDFKNLNRTGLVNYIIKKHIYISRPEPGIDILHSQISADIGDLHTESRRIFIQKNEEFFTRHKAAKLVANSLRVYEHFGLEWRMPLWDDELMKFWYSVNEEERFDSRLYDGYLLENIFKDCGVAFLKNDIGGVQKRISKYKYVDLLYRFLKPYIKRAFYMVRPPKYYDFNAFGVLKDILCEDLKCPVIPDEPVNQVYAKWFIQRVFPAERRCADEDSIGKIRQHDSRSEAEGGLL